MGRSEKWTDPSVIRQELSCADDPSCGAGPILYTEHGRKYTDDSERHICVIGRSGTGKTQCAAHPSVRQTLRKGENLIVAETKGDIYEKNAWLIPDHYQKFVIDLRHPRKSLTCWNPLSYIKTLLDSGDPEDRDMGSTMLGELWSCVYPLEGDDPFWPGAAANFAEGLSYGLMETAEPQDIHMASIANMMEQAETNFASSTAVHKFYDLLDKNSPARTNLASVVTGPSDTRKSIVCVANKGIKIFSRSSGLMDLLSRDTLHLQDLDVSRPFALFVITPDETSQCDALAGLLISQVCQHLIQIAQKQPDGKLPIRVNVILEELGSLGKSIPALPNLMAASRSRNMRIMLILQSYGQLNDVYGRSQAESILSNVGITMGFSTNDWDTLANWSQRCGERVSHSPSAVREHLITPAQLAAMPTGTALIMTGGGSYKFITHLPFYDELYDNSGWVPPEPADRQGRESYVPFDFVAFVRKLMSEDIKKKLTEKQGPVFSAGMTGRTPFSNPFGFQTPSLPDLEDCGMGAARFEVHEVKESPEDSSSSRADAESRLAELRAKLFPEKEPSEDSSTSSSPSIMDAETELPEEEDDPVMNTAPSLEANQERSFSEMLEDLVKPSGRLAERSMKVSAYRVTVLKAEDLNATLNILDKNCFLPRSIIRDRLKRLPASFFFDDAKNTVQVLNSLKKIHTQVTLKNITVFDDEDDDDEED